MKIKYIYQNNNKKIHYNFDFDKEKIQITYNGKTEIFDFGKYTEDGKAEIETVLDICPVLNSKRENGVLYIELLKTYTDEEKEQIEDNLKDLEAWWEGKND